MGGRVSHFRPPGVSVLVGKLDSMALRSPTRQPVIPMTLTGLGKCPFLVQRQTVGAEIPNSSITVVTRTIAESGKESN